jgi:hypothetical protein
MKRPASFGGVHFSRVKGQLPDWRTLRMNRVITLALLGLGLAAFTPGQGVGNTSQVKDGKQIRVQATASPTSLDFGDQVVQTIGKELTVTITNKTDKPIEIRSVDTTQDGEDFVVDYENNQCADLAIETGKSCSIGVVFYPLLLGERKSFLLITYDNADDPQRISLRGNSIKANR